MLLTKYHNAENIEVSFDDGIKLKKRNFTNIKQIKNPNRITVCGVGKLGYVYTKGIKGKNHRKCYYTWRNMIGRCTVEEIQERQPTYKNCNIEDNWFSFDNFENWYNSQYYECEEKLELDKDILVHNNKTYGEKFCCLVPKRINLLISKSRLSKEFGLPVGVSKKRERFCVGGTKVNNNTVYLGIYDTPEEAFLVYKKYKEDMIKMVADDYKQRGQITEKVYQALMNYEVDITD